MFLEIKRNSHQSENLLVDEIELEAQIKRNKIADIIMAAFAWCTNGLVNEEARRYFEGCQIDDPSQLHHDCMTMEQKENWICYYERAKAQLKVEKLWSEIEKKILTKLDVYLEDSWLKYFLQLLKVDVTSAFLLYKHYERRENEEVDECLRLGCYDYM